MITSKKLRALVGKLREAQLYSEDIVLAQGELSYLVKIDEVAIENVRNINQSFGLRIVSDSNFDRECENTKLLISVDDENFQLTLYFKNEAENGLEYTIITEEIINFERRKSDRKTLAYPSWAPAMLIESKTRYCVEVLTKVLDFDDRFITFVIDSKESLSELNIDATFELCFPDNILPFKQTKFSTLSSREYKVIDEGARRTILVCILSESTHFEDAAQSIIKIEESISLPLYFHLRIAVLFNVIIGRLYCDGFVSKNVADNISDIPMSFTAELVDVGIFFNVYKDNEKLFFKLVANNIGERVKWYNYLTSRVYNAKTSFSDVNVKSITRLIIDANLQSAPKIQERINLHPLIDLKWSNEKKFSKTKFRWIIKDHKGRLLGHLAALRVSTSIWAAIDNIGNQSYEGSWNKNYVKRWLLTLKEILNESSSTSLIQWTHIRSAKVWDKFEASLKQNKSLFKVDTTMQIGHFKKKLETDLVDTECIAIEKINFDSEVTSMLSSYPLLFWNNLFMGVESINSDFQTDFHEDYHFGLKRYSYKLSYKEKTSFLVTYSNYPFWTSINNAHNFCYIFPLEDKNGNIDLATKQEIVESLKKQMYLDGCLPEIYAFVSSQLTIPDCIEVANYLLYPKAIDLVILQLEGKI